MADARKKLDLNPTFLRDETERGQKFWNKTVVEMKFNFEKEWIRGVRKLPEREKPNYGMGNMDPILEELTGNKLELVGPMLDSYLQEIGQLMGNKLTRAHEPCFFIYPIFDIQTSMGSYGRISGEYVC